jgi:hypothetical protein
MVASMVKNPVVVAAGILLVVSITATVLLWPTPVEDRPDAFHAIVLLLDAQPNETDPSHLDAAMWVAVAAGEPKPRWSRVDVVAAKGASCETVHPPVLEVDDLDHDGLLTRGDIVHLNGLAGAYWNGTVTLRDGNETIGSVSIHHAAEEGQPPGSDRDLDGRHNGGAVSGQGAGDDRELREARERGLLRQHDLPQDHQGVRGADR